MIKKDTYILRTHKLGQNGLVSFTVTMILMMVVTLIIVGFTQLVIRNRQDTIDKQLSTQALYAAETGVNDTVKALRGLYAANASNVNYTPPRKSTCNDPSPYDPVAPATKTLASGVSYSCVLVTPNSRWIQTSATVNGSKVVPIEAVNDNGTPVAIYSLKFSWKPTLEGTKNDCPPNRDNFPASLGACPYGMLRVDLYKAEGPVTSADALNDETQTFYFLPKSVDDWNIIDMYEIITNNNNSLNLHAHKASANCSETACTAFIDLREPIGTVSKFYARLSSTYIDIPSVTITGSMNDGWVYPGLSFKGQTRIDVTGKAQNVLRRVQVQVSSDTFGSDLVPNATAHSSGTVCKRFIAAPSYYESFCAEDETNIP